MSVTRNAVMANLAETAGGADLVGLRDPQPPPESSGPPCKPGSRLRVSVTDAEVTALLFKTTSGVDDDHAVWSPTRPLVRNLLDLDGPVRRLLMTGAAVGMGTTVATLFPRGVLPVYADPLNDVLRGRLGLTREQEQLVDHLAHGDLRLVVATLARLLACEWAVVIHVPARASMVVVYQARVPPSGVGHVRSLPVLGFHLQRLAAAGATTATTPPAVVVPIFEEDVKTLPSPATLLWVAPVETGPLALRQVLWLEPLPLVDDAPATHYWAGYDTEAPTARHAADDDEDAERRDFRARLTHAAAAAASHHDE
jgi:hypothetical protein